MRQTLIAPIALALGLLILDRTDNPPPDRTQIHAEVTGRAIASAEAQVARTSAAMDAIRQR